MTAIYALVFLCLSLSAFFLAAGRAQKFAEANAPLHSRPVYHGLFMASLVLISALAVFILGWPVTAWIGETRALAAFPAGLTADTLQRQALLRTIHGLVAGENLGTVDPALAGAAQIYVSTLILARRLVLLLGAIVACALSLLLLRHIAPEFRARAHFERILGYVLFASAAVAVFTTIGIVFSVVVETWRFFQLVSPIDFLFGLEWNPQAALRADQGDFSGAFGIVPLVTGTLLITLIAMCVAGPIGLTSAIYMAEYATPRTRAIVKPMLEILAGIPTVVLGFFAALTVAPFIRNLGASVGLSVASESALAAGLVMGMMIIPFVSSLSDDVMNAVPQSLRDGSYALGSTKSETIKNVVLPAALPGIVSAFMLAISRAIGETMIVLMAAGLAANLTFNPLEAVTTFTVQIKTILVGDQEFDSAKTLSAFALAFVLFFLTLMLNIIALRIVKRYRERYD
jgi:phosphate transport system permease protein